MPHEHLSIQILILQITRWVYNIFLHPLAAFPGPLLWRASRVPFERSLVRGRILKDLTVVHAKYGEVVRVAPGILSFIHPSAWPDIYTHSSTRGPFLKDPLRYTKDTYINGHPDVFAADDTDHSRLRRLLQPIFSDRALREQEPLIQAVVDLLVSQLRERTDSSFADSPASGVVDIATWLNWTTFDLIGDLAFGETFSCLARGSYHSWVALIVSSIKAITILGAIKQFPWLDRAWQFLIGRFWMRAMRRHQRLVIEKVDSRLERKTTRKDFTEFILNHQNSKNEKMSKGEMYSNLSLLIMAGSDTSATALSGTLYHLAKNSHELRALQAEIRAKFQAEADITFESFAGIPTLLAALKESMRLYPSQPIFTPRKVPKGGAQVAGKWIPEGVSFLFVTVFLVIIAVIFKSHRHCSRRQPSGSFSPSLTIPPSISSTRINMTLQGGSVTQSMRAIVAMSSNHFRSGQRVVLGCSKIFLHSPP